MFLCSNGVLCTLGSAYNEFGYNEHPVKKSRFLYAKTIDGMDALVAGYNEVNFESRDIS